MVGCQPDSGVLRWAHHQGSEVRSAVKRAAFVALVVPLLCVMLGCGGGSAPPEDPGSSEIAGRITGADDPTGYTLTLDGQPVDVTPGANGTFVIPNVPPGAHTVGCIAPGGARGGYGSVVVVDGQRAEMPPIVAGPAGQIAGIVTRMLDGGGLELVADVEVIAAPSTLALPGGDVPLDTSSPVPIGRGGEPDRVIIGAFTDADGSYLMKAVPPGLYDVSLVVAGYEPLVQFAWVAPGTTSAVDFMLVPAREQGVGTVKGVVMGKGVGPLEGARITVTTGSPWPVPLPCEVVDALAEGALAGIVAPCPLPPVGDTGDPTDPGGGPGGMPWIEVDVFTTLTDHEGAYSLNVPVGTHFIECWLEGWEWDGAEVTIEKDQTTRQSFRLEEWGDPPPPPPPLPAGS